MVFAHPKMPAPIDPKLKAQIRRAYVNSKLTFQELARQFDVSDRSIQNWAKAENWDAERKAENVIEFARQPKQERPTRRQVEGIDDLKVIEEAIAELSAALVGSETPATALGSIATALGRLIEQKRKLKPETVEELAQFIVDRMKDLGIEANDLAVAMRQRVGASRSA